MRVAYISRIVGDRSVFLEVDAPGMEHLIKPGDSMSLDDVYCRHILEGRLPELIPDTSAEPIAMAMPITAAVPIGAHVSVPIRDRDGQVLGMFCCLSPEPNQSLNARDLQVARILADIVAQQMIRVVDQTRRVDALAASTRRVLAEKAFSIVYQPIWDFHTLQPVGVEALCRFTEEPYRSPDQWFAEAFEAGLGVDLELAAIEASLGALSVLPEPIYVSVNASPQTILSGRLMSVLDGAPLGRVALEVTEHAEVDDYGELAAALQPLREAGVRLSIDDAGAGFSSLQHILQLKPDRIKLDMSLTRSIDSDPARRALASALVFFVREMGSKLIAEGIERQEELDVLRMLGVHKGQGYLLARPSDLETVRGLIGKPPQRLIA